MVTLLIILTTLAPISWSQAAAADPFGPLSSLIGTWEGVAEGRPGKGTARRTYSRALDNRFIRAVHRNEYPPQEKNPKGEIHEDEGFFSVDRARKRIVFRQFHTEGFAVTYVETGETTATRIVFESEGIENIPAGYRTRETYVWQGPDVFEETFEMAAPGKPFEVYSKTVFRRVR